jgi:aspartate beta-hydroxylase
LAAAIVVRPFCVADIGLHLRYIFSGSVVDTAVHRDREWRMKSLYENAGNIIRRIYDLRIKGPPVLDTATDFPSAELFSGAWQRIRDEALAVAQQMHRVPRFHEIMREQTAISANDGRDWRMFILKAYGTEFPHNMAVCPNLAAAVAASPEVLSASLSFLAPRKHIPEHRGPFRGVLRFYLVLSMPLEADGRPAAVLKIDSAEHRLADGEFLLWDDTFPHEVTNGSDEVRAVLLLDVWRRGMPLDMRLLSRLLIFIVGAMARIRGVE